MKADVWHGKRIGKLRWLSNKMFRLARHD
jgi:hypothetical protein